MGFLDIIFPEDISYSSSGGPSWNTHVIVNDGGSETRITKWVVPRMSFDAVKAIQDQDQIKDLIAFTRITEGAAHSWRYMDWSDYASTLDGLNSARVDEARATAAITKDDQPIGTGDTTTTSFQLIKRYQFTSGLLTIEKNRNITKPVKASVIIALDGVLKTETVDYTVDGSTGIITFTTAPAQDVLITAGYEFHVPCRFGESLDRDGLPIDITAFEQNDVRSIPIIEVVDVIPTEEQRFAGGARSFTLEGAATSYQVGVNDAKVLVVNPIGSSLKVFLPALGNLPRGGELFMIRNDNATNTLEIFPVGGAGSKLLDLLPLTNVRIFKGVNVTPSDIWIFV